jgi:hypothetical protein
VLGVLRTDGLLMPFAAFDGDAWTTPWPGSMADAAGRELPLNLDAVPRGWWGGEVPATWKLWPREGGEALPIKPIAPVMTPMGALRRLALKTDYSVRTPSVPPSEFPFPKAGLVVGGQATVSPIATVSRATADWQKLLGRILPDVDGAEERTITALRSNTGWMHPVDRRIRVKVPPILETWYTTPLPEQGSFASYIEAVKRYPPGPDDRGCGLESVVSGWVHQVAGEPRLQTELKAVVGYCDREHVSYMLPFGYLRLDNRLHWVFQMSGRDHEWYVVTEVAPGRSRVRAEHFAGGDPRLVRKGGGG